MNLNRNFVSAIKYYNKYYNLIRIFYIFLYITYVSVTIKSVQ